MTGPQFAHQCIGSPPWPAPDDKAAHDERCWLCGGDTGGAGWAKWKVFALTFTNVNTARVPTSDTVCDACVYLSTSEPWKEYGAAHPEMELKTVHPLSWRTYSHVFSAAGHRCPNRAEVRALLLDPPEPPFVFTVALSGQKHLLFRSQVAYGRDQFPVLVEEELVQVDRERFAECLEAFEKLYNLGFSRDDILSGRYHLASMKRAGLEAWRIADSEFRPWRTQAPDYVKIAHFCPDVPADEDPARRGCRYPSRGGDRPGCFCTCMARQPCARVTAWNRRSSGYKSSVRRRV